MVIKIKIIHKISFLVLYYKCEKIFFVNLFYNVNML
nr:MAG TPA: hypothetical protein [Caudoviricetes sp.]